MSAQSVSLISSESVTDDSGFGLTPDLGTLLLERTRKIGTDICARVRRVISQPLHILCVDDSRDAADTLAALLEHHGYMVQACYGGDEALKLLETFEPNVFLIDLGMPQMDGLELATRLKNRAGSRPMLLIAVTAWGSLEVRTQTALAGFHYHFVKPIETAALIEVLERFANIHGRSCSR